MSDWSVPNSRNSCTPVNRAAMAKSEFQRFQFCRWTHAKVNPAPTRRMNGVRMPSKMLTASLSKRSPCSL